ncbi:GNAT family N-acetyltransferase [Natronobacterium texcoconense]|uniref:Acetyltransferase (GNAT) family protein n=1 Tax=Natronobacterium texcoconense TaxID=1095778 RepID=A0A1H1FP12_NATTX|nr:GNAT family N-acetyltransferase [Natronobacterium texcoconense]SDR02644.1 Acetyltransferase (GNAT) family protein [Natronobacterium texcoconense]
MAIRPYRAETDADALWELKRAFETELGSGTGGEEKAARYDAKLTDDYRTDYLEWVDRCLDSDERSVQVAVEDGDIAGYVFLLPETQAYIWDAAVLNEIYVREEHRGTGVADDLMDAAIDAARDQDLPLERIVLDVDRKNERAQAFYDRHGFDHWGELVARNL